MAEKIRVYKQGHWWWLACAGTYRQFWNWPAAMEAALYLLKVPRGR